MLSVVPDRLWTCCFAVATMLTVSASGLVGQETGALTGTVVSLVAAADGEAVSAVTVRLPALQESRITDEQGRFEFEVVPPGTYDVLAEVMGCPVASWTVDIDPGDRTVLNLLIDRPAIQLPGFTVLGLRSEEEAERRAYSVGRIGGEGLERRSARSIADLIRGEFPGARVMQGSGLPGEEISIQFRGPESISGARPPLMVVDGAITGGGIIDLDPRDVENITVLRGAAAAAQYGSRGQAGVIEITTRDGGTTESEESGPLVIVDGTLSVHGIAAVDPGDILLMDLVTGSAAELLFGPSAVRTGVVRIITRAGSTEAESGTLAQCFVPSR